MRPSSSGGARPMSSGGNRPPSARPTMLERSAPEVKGSKVSEDEAKKFG